MESRRHLKSVNAFTLMALDKRLVVPQAGHRILRMLSVSRPDKPLKHFPPNSNVLLPAAKYDDPWVSADRERVLTNTQVRRNDNPSLVASVVNHSLVVLAADRGVANANHIQS